MAYTFSPSTVEAKAGGSLEFKASLAQGQVLGQPGLLGEKFLQGRQRNLSLFIPYFRVWHSKLCLSQESMVDEPDGTTVPFPAGGV